ncbi:MAG: hypothetical protein H6727_17645 [Myxococcales bacterium]|nr:hypothetical protein [Myxococcales bacterium]
MYACIFFCMASVACVDPTKPPPTQVGECKTDLECIKKQCPQTDPNEYKRCADALHTFDNGGPNYVTCALQAEEKDNKCTTLSLPLSSGQFIVKFPETLSTQMEDAITTSLRQFTFPKIDLNGKPIDCARLKALNDSNPEGLMDVNLGRYYPNRVGASPFDTPIKAPFATSLPLFFEKIPAGKHLVVVMGFCRKDTPITAATKGDYFACKEVEFKEAPETPAFTIETEVEDNLCFK